MNKQLLYKYIGILLVCVYGQWMQSSCIHSTTYKFIKLLLQRILNNKEKRAQVQINLFDPKFIASPGNVVNSSFNIGTVQSVYYLSYPNLVGANNLLSRSTGVAGIIILSTQNGNPTAYILTGQNGLGWSIGSLGDTPSNNNNAPVPLSFTVLASSIYCGKNTGPQIPSNFIAQANTIIGHNSLQFSQDDPVNEYNTSVGCCNNNGFAKGSYNVLVGGYNLSNISPENYLSFTNVLSTQNNPLMFTSDYNIALGNMLMGDSSQRGTITRFPNNNNIVVGNFTLRNAYSSNNNIIFGMGSFVPQNDFFQGFVGIQGNISIGNNLMVSVGNQYYQNVFNNIFLVPDAQNLTSLNNTPPATQMITNNTESAIFLGTLGDATPNKDRSNTTYIANLYNKFLYQATTDSNASYNKQAVNVPHVLWTSYDNAVVSPIIWDTTDALTQPELDDIVENELYILPIFCSPLSLNTLYLYAIDANYVAQNTSAFPHLKDFLINYSLPSSVNQFHTSNAGEMAGYEYVYLIPLMIRALQIQAAELAACGCRKRMLKEKIKTLIEKRSNKTKKKTLADDILEILSEYADDE